MENKQTDLEEVIDEVTKETNDDNVTKVKIRKSFSSGEDDNVYKVDLSKPVNNETEEPEQPEPESVEPEPGGDAEAKEEVQKEEEVQE